MKKWPHLCWTYIIIKQQRSSIMKKWPGHLSWTFTKSSNNKGHANHACWSATHVPCHLPRTTFPSTAWVVTLTCLSGQSCSASLESEGSSEDRAAELLRPGRGKVVGIYPEVPGTKNKISHLFQEIYVMFNGGLVQICLWFDFVDL